MNKATTIDKGHILIIDDDQDIRELLSKYLKQNQFETTTLADGEKMNDVLAKNSIDLVVLDVMLPGDDGFSLCRQIRNFSNMPVIMLTAVSEETDRIIGLELGADDYLTKPFNPRELLARIKAILRRHNAPTTSTGDKRGNKLVFSGWVLDKSTRSLTSPKDVDVVLSAGEYDLLLALLSRPQRVLNRDQLLDYTKNREAGPFDRSIDIQISRLRQKIEDNPKQPEIIKTVRGGGYMLTASVEIH